MKTVRNGIGRGIEIGAHAVWGVESAAARHVND